MQKPDSRGSVLWRSRRGPWPLAWCALSSPSALATLVSEHLNKLNIKCSKGDCVSFVPLATEISSALNSP